MAWSDRLRKSHLVLMIVWFLLIAPTVLFWKDSVLWVALMSCWANAAAHFAAWQGARSEKASEDSG
jgi:hypothetical protein